MLGFPGRAGGYLRGPVHAGLACGWWTCVVLLDLRRLLMAREPPGPAASCRKRKALSMGEGLTPPFTRHRARPRRQMWREEVGVARRGTGAEAWASAGLPFLEGGGSPSPPAGGGSKRQGTRPSREPQQRLCVHGAVHPQGTWPPQPTAACGRFLRGCRGSALSHTPTHFASRQIQMVVEQAGQRV